MATDIALESVALAIARVIARKTVAEDPRLKRMDAIMKASAINTLAQQMAPSLVDEAKAALDAMHLLAADAA